MSKALARAVENPPAIAPDMLDVAGLLLGAGRGQTTATQLTLIDAAIILLDRARERLAPAPAEAPVNGKQRRKRRARVARAVKAAPAEKPERAPQPQPARGGASEEAEPEIHDHNDVTVTVGGATASVEHAERTIEVTARQGRLVACLARAMPQPVGRDFVARRVWIGQRVPDASGNIISSLITPIIGPLAAIGLTLKTVRGVGIALQREGE